MPTHHGADIAYRISLATRGLAPGAPVYTVPAGTVGAPAGGLNPTRVGILEAALKAHYPGDSFPAANPIYYTTVDNGLHGLTPQFGNYYVILSALTRPVVYYDDHTILVGPNIAITAVAAGSPFTGVVAANSNNF